VIDALPLRDPAVALTRLVAYEVSDLLLEGGAALQQAVWAAGVVDRVRLYVAPVVLGSAGVRWMPGGRLSFAALTGCRTEWLGDDALLEADVQRFD
jgi:diaminohydroxyphosphoribosylaminopyrimidine deaminase/5-amino-6-(5-phosphoribosylamino)uracil reductase